MGRWVRGWSSGSESVGRRQCNERLARPLRCFFSPLRWLADWLSERNASARREICARVQALATEEAASHNGVHIRSTGFLDKDVGGSFLANAYELRVRLDHTLTRIEILLGAGVAAD